jgi:transposase
MKKNEDLINYINNYVRKDELIKKIKLYEIKVRNMKFIIDVLNGLSVAEASKKYNVTRQYGYKIIKNGFKNKNIVKGRPCKLNNSQLKNLINYLNNKKCFKIEEAVNFIGKNYNVKYSNRQIKKILNNFNFKYYKIFNGYANKKYYEKIIKEIFCSKVIQK